MKNQVVYWIIKLTAVVILLQTLFFKFTGASESVYIFETLGVEPYGRIGSGVVELLASVFILFRRTTLLGAIMAAGTMFGALVSHLFILGIVIQNDGGTLFTLAIITLVCSLLIIYTERHKIPDLLRFKL
ncbi:DoxX-like family protein [Flavobacterium fontis]|uniref:DoxX-like family protein n=1 Tax=Flavobacterium fontis TaxID=1124188 RepID=A0A1M5D5L5_9FLAO|nr:DoxX family protein [Flavobacterium fontis]SHF62278.1 DoxX-like family protein [Flavobacterium fontis]